MTENPKCANCYEEIAWNPVLANGDVFCCDGCGIGGPCVCTYSSPPPKLDTKDILKAAGYDLEALATELSVCANCFEEFAREPVLSKGIAYCCEGCTRGGPCKCTYTDGAGGQTTNRVPEAVPDVEYGGPFLADGDADFDEVDMKAEAKGDSPGYLKTNSLWKHISEWEESSPYEDYDEDDQRVNDFWLLRSEIAGTDEPEKGEADGTDAEPMEYDFDPELDLESSGATTSRLSTFKVVASPLDKISDVRAFTAALDSTPSVEAAILTHYSGDSATFEIEAGDLDKVLRELLEADSYPVRSFSMSPDGLGLTLRSRSGDLLATAARSEESGSPQYVDGASSNGTSVVTDGSEGVAFKFEMGVDVFFNGRHHVEISGIEGPVHMHSWRIQATLAGESGDEAGSAAGNQQVKDILTAYVSRFNEKLLNKVSPFDKIMPSSNNIAKVIYDHVSHEMDGKTSIGYAAVLKSIKLWESPTSYVEYSGDARAA